jgi:hypothetical protein
VYRQEALHKALAVLGAHSLQFGSDRFLPCSAGHIRSAVDEVTQLLDCLDLDQEGREAIFSGTAAAWLGIPR